MGSVSKKTKYCSIRKMADLDRGIFARKITELIPATELTRFR